MIYFIQSETGSIKIGYTRKSGSSRLKSLQSSSSEKLKLLANMVGDFKTEKELHIKFSSNKIHGEWFKPTSELMEFIKENALLEDTNEVEKQEMDKLQLLIAESIKTLRLSKNMSRENLCIKAGVSMNALRHLEDASSATIRTLVRVVKALNCQGWLFNLAPIISINPLDKIRGGKPRRRGRL